MRQKASIELVIHLPRTEGGRQALAERAARVHADLVEETAAGLDCPDRQKLDLLQAVLDTVRGGSKPKT